MKKYVNLKCISLALGDTLACVAVVEHYQNVFSIDMVNFDCADWLWKYLQPAYPNINFTKLDSPDLLLNYHFDLPVQKGYAFELFQIPVAYKYEFDWVFINPKLHFKPTYKYILNEYFTFSMHSTAQIKYWNSGNRQDQNNSPKWRDLNLLLSNIGIEGVLVDKHYGFGQAPYWNEPPKNCKVIVGRPFDEILNTIYFSRFYVGLSSGLSWVALAMGKKTCMIAPWTYADNEFGNSSENHIRIMSKASCTDCWSKLSQNFDKGNWYWCPLKQNTKDEYICSSSIEPKDVFKEIKKYKWI